MHSSPRTGDSLACVRRRRRRRESHGDFFFPLGEGEHVCLSLSYKLTLRPPGSREVRISQEDVESSARPATTLQHRLSEQARSWVVLDQ
jgi:hypothetical protein